jgi:hypothetical protein
MQLIQAFPTGQRLNRRENNVAKGWLGKGSWPLNGLCLFQGKSWVGLTSHRVSFVAGSSRGRSKRNRIQHIVGFVIALFRLPNRCLSAFYSLSRHFLRVKPCNRSPSKWAIMNTGASPFLSVLSSRRTKFTVIFGSRFGRTNAAANGSKCKKGRTQKGPKNCFSAQLSSF